MNLHYFYCELCGAQLLHRDDSNKSKFPVTRCFEDNDETKNLLTVRCAECVGIPYWLIDGNPSRSYRFDADGVTIIKELNREYNDWSHGIGHLLELYISEPDDEALTFIRNAAIEIGFLVEEDINLIILAHRFLPQEWMVTPYQWNFYKDFARAIPPINPFEANERKFTVAVINDKGGRYLVIREGILPFEFAKMFHAAIQKQIERGQPTNIDEYRYRVSNLYELIMDNEVDSTLKARTLIEQIEGV